MKIRAFHFIFMMFLSSFGGTPVRAGDPPSCIPWEDSRPVEDELRLYAWNMAARITSEDRRLVAEFARATAAKDAVGARLNATVEEARPLERELRRLRWNGVSERDYRIETLKRRLRALSLENAGIYKELQVAARAEDALWLKLVTSIDAKVEEFRQGDGMALGEARFDSIRFEIRLCSPTKTRCTRIVLRDLSNPT
jgi:hypothetical protein